MISTEEFIIRLLVAMAAGIVIGIERQFHNRNGGLRTNTLVAVGAAIFVLISLRLSHSNGGDSTRVIGQVVTGMGFLGAGVILHQGVAIIGITTAATIWCSAAIGCMAAAGYFIETAISTLLILIINFLMHYVDVWIVKKTKIKDS
jgi:putative Mg2+ transporter-C (MgtC) family protein